MRSFLCLLMLATWGVASAQSLREDADAYLREEVRQQNVAGLAVAIIRPLGTVFQGTYGYADLQRATAVTPDSTFALGSTGQLFLNLGALALAEKGLIDLEAPADQSMPGVRLRQALTQTSGLANFLDDAELEPSASTSFEQAIRAVQRAGSPGTKTGYSDTNALLVTRSIESATSQPAALWIRQCIFSPSGMASTSSNPSGASAVGYRYDGTSLVRDPGVLAPVAPLYGAHFVTSLSDMIRWSRAFSTKSGLKRSTWDLATMPPKSGGDFGMAMQNGVFDGETKWIGREGGIDGYSSAFVHIPESQTSIVILSNSGGLDTLSIAQGLAFLVKSDDNSPK